MRKLFETLAAACLALALLPMAALADGGGSPAAAVVDTGEELSAAVANGGAVKLGGDITISSALEIDEDVALDLNGKTLTLAMLTIDEGCALTLTDSSAGGNGKISTTGVDSYGSLAYGSLAGTLRANGGAIVCPDSRYGTLSVKSTGSIECDSPTPTDFSIYVAFSGTISGGNFKETVRALPGGTISGGTFAGNVFSLDDALLRISGGTFERVIYALSVVSGGVFYGETIGPDCSIAEGACRIAFKNGGDIYATEVVASGGKTAAPRDPGKEHFAFGGWLDESGDPYVFGGTLAADATLHAKWTPHRYAISYDLRGGSFAEGKTVPVEHVYGTETPLVSPEREGWIFGGWYADAGFAGDAVRSLDATGCTGDVELHAKWVPADELDYRWYDADAEGYVISNAAQLRGFANLVNGTVYVDGLERTGFEGKTVRLAADIDLAGADWAPIGSIDGDKAFRGVFDGDGRTVSNLVVDSGATCAGLFGYAHGATVKNLSVSGSVAGSGSYVGGVVGWLNGGEIENCSFSGSVAGSGHGCRVGGVAGAASGAISRCGNSASVVGTGQGALVGGIAGQAEGDVRYCGNRGAVSAAGDYARVGGIAGLVLPLGDDRAMRSCCSAGAVSAAGEGALAGGAAGYVWDTDERLTVDGVYYLEGSAPRGIGAIRSDEYPHGAVAGVAGDGAVAGSAAAFGGGEAAWLLQAAADEGDGPVWGQAIGKDPCPVPGGDAVCRVVFKVDGEDYLVRYVNKGGAPAVPDPAAPAGCAFAGWYTEAAGGAEFELGGGVAGDMTLHARWADVAEPAEPEPPAADVLANTGDDAHAAARAALLLASACALAVAAAARAGRLGRTR